MQLSTQRTFRSFVRFLAIGFALALSMSVVGGAPPARADAPPQLGVSVLPTSSGTPIVGERFVASTGSWIPRSTEVTFQWLSDGQPIVGATQSAYYPSASDVGKRLSTAVTGMKPGYSSRTEVTAQSGVIVEGKARIAVAYIGGVAQVGSTLIAYAGTSTRSPVTVSVAWLRDGVLIPGATNDTYLLSGSDLGRSIRFRVTASGAGYQSTTATSPAVGPVTP